MAEVEPRARHGSLIIMLENDYYKTLGVQPTDGPEVIAQAYRQLARQFHPDVRPGDVDAATHFKEINVAYETLSDPAKRAQYDAERANHPQGAPGAEVSSATEPMTPPAPQDEQTLVYQGSVTLNNADIESALGDFRSALTEAANEVADELRGALSDFAQELDAIARTGGDVSKYRSQRPGFPAPRGAPHPKHKR